MVSETAFEGGEWDCLRGWWVRLPSRVVSETALEGGEWDCLRVWWVRVPSRVVSETAFEGGEWDWLRGWWVRLPSRVVSETAFEGGEWDCLRGWWVRLPSRVVSETAFEGGEWDCLRGWWVRLPSRVVSETAFEGGEWDCLRGWWVRLPSRAMSQLFNGVHFVYRSVEVYWTFCSYLRVLVRIRNFYTGDLSHYVLNRLFDNLMDKSYWNVDDWNNVDSLRIITRGSNSKCQLTIGVFSIVFAMSVIEKVGEFQNTLTMQYELRYKWWINAVVMILYVTHYLCWLFYFQNIITLINLCCWNLLKWHSRFSYKVAGNAVLRDHGTVLSRLVVLKWWTIWVGDTIPINWHCEFVTLFPSIGIVGWWHYSHWHCEFVTLFPSIGIVSWWHYSHWHCELVTLFPLALTTYKTLSTGSWINFLCGSLLIDYH